MAEKNVISLVLNADIPFIRETGVRFAFQEMPFFETIDETLLPLLDLCERLDAKHIRFRCALVVPPVFCHLLNDGSLIDRYLHYVDNRIEFGAREIVRLKKEDDARALARFYRAEAEKKRESFCSRYKKNLLGALLAHVQRGRIELLGSAATNAFLPFYAAFPAVISAQLETGRRSARRFFRSEAEGFWLPELGYCSELDEILKRRFAWTIVDTHTALLAAPAPKFGSFFPLITAKGVVLLVRDFSAGAEIMNMSGRFPPDSAFRSYFDDAGYELPVSEVKPFLSANGIRAATGYKYRTVGSGGFGKELYNPKRGFAAACSKAHDFLDRRRNALAAARAAGVSLPASICVYNAGFFGRFWFEGMRFLEELFCAAADSSDVQFLTPSEYLEKLNAHEFQRVTPEYSSQGYNGYAESYLDSANDWVYRHLLRASERMVELAGRFAAGADDLRERALNQAAREILLAQTSDWARIMSAGEHHLTHAWSNYAGGRLETHLRNFTTFYEALGGDYISTRLLTELELKNALFPEMNYRVFDGGAALNFAAHNPINS